MTNPNRAAALWTDCP